MLHKMSSYTPIFESVKRAKCGETPEFMTKTPNVENHSNKNSFQRIGHKLPVRAKSAELSIFCLFEEPHLNCDNTSGKRMDHVMIQFLAFIYFGRIPHESFI